MVATDVDDIETAISGLPVTVQRLTTRDEDVRLTASSLDGVEVLAGEFGFPIATEGEIAGDCLVLTLLLEEGPGSWNGKDFALDRVWMYRPGSEHVGVGLASDGARPPRFATISMPLPVAPPEWAQESSLVAVVDDDRVRSLRGSVIDILTAGRPDQLSDRQAALARRQLIDIVSALGADIGGPRVDRTSAAWITQECIAIADANDPMPATADLGAALGVSDRWVRAAFQKMFGVSASAFFRARAMDGAHRELRQAAPGSVSVTEVAMRWGFWHLGRFSATYRSFFGELPSETLARTD
jgi:AraC-like DNA-binding protein